MIQHKTELSKNVETKLLKERIPVEEIKFHTGVFSISYKILPRVRQKPNDYKTTTTKKENAVDLV